jgi:hypothetical protein
MVVVGKIVGAQIGRKNQGDDAVRLPSFSIAEMMVLVAIVATDCLAARAGQPVTFVFLVIGGLPMQSALVIGLLLVFRWQRRMEKLLPFLVGFEVGGWIVHVIYVLLCTQAAERIDAHLVNMLDPLLRASGFPPFSTPDWIIWTCLAMFYVTAPQLLIALVAGWISQRLWKQSHAERVPKQE